VHPDRQTVDRGLGNPCHAFDHPGLSRGIEEPMLKRGIVNEVGSVDERC
jgi:hypothetical protein